jgi:NAD-dependent DNA ligase
MLRKLEKLGVNYGRKNRQQQEATLADKRFCLRVPYPVLSDRRPKKWLKGGKILGGVSSKLNYTIAGEDASSS